MVRKCHTNRVDKLRKRWYSTNCTKRVVCLKRFFEAAEPGKKEKWPAEFCFCLKNADTNAFYRKGTRFSVFAEGFQAGAAFAHIIGSIFWRGIF